MRHLVAIAVAAAALCTTFGVGATTPLPAPATSDTARGLEPGMSANAAEAYRRTDAMMRRSQEPGVARAMLQTLIPIVRKERHPLLVGRLVVAAAAVASSDGGDAEVHRLVAAAEADPSDGVGRFVAGVAVHYRGHVRGMSREAKSADYRQAIALLEPLRDTFKASPRLWIYLAVSYVRTGQQKSAETAISRAVEADSGSDADVYYCRAEVYHRTAPKRALADVERYLQIMRRNERRGAFSAPGKEAKVRHMRAHMQKVVAGTASPGGLELFDPIRDPAPAASRWMPWAWRAVYLAAAIIALLWLRRLLTRR